MKDKPLVSIIINNYNYERFLEEAINSALNQTYCNTEIIVVDDGSTDNSREIITSYGTKITPVLKKNGGQASAFNAGFAASQGDIICFLDSDDIFLPEKVADIVDVFEDRPDVGWCFHLLKFVDTNGEALADQNDSKEPSGECDLRTHIKRGKLKGKLPFGGTATSGVSLRRSLLQMILPMPEAIRITSDDYVKYTALALSKGFVSGEKLTLQRIHNNNAYTFRKDKQGQFAQVLILTAYWMRVNSPFLAKFTNNLFAAGLGVYWRIQSINTEYEELVKAYLALVTPLERLEINTRALYYRLKS